MDNSEIKSTVEIVTPEIASSWLFNNTNNRRQKKSVIGNFSNAMLRGDWLVGQPIMFDVNGRLIDGQHRLLAVIKAGIPIKFLVVRNCLPESFDKLDIGSRRTNSDILYMEGSKYSEILAPALSIIDAYNCGQLQLFQERAPTPTQCLKLLANNKGIKDSVEFICGLPNRYVLSYSIAAFCHYLFSKTDSEKATDFFNGLYQGNNLQEGSPILVLRNKLTEDRASQRKYRKIFLIAFVFKAWKLYLKNESAKYIRWNPYGDSPEKFPELVIK